MKFRFKLDLTSNWYCSSAVISSVGMEGAFLYQSVDQAYCGVNCFFGQVLVYLILRQESSSQLG